MSKEITSTKSTTKCPVCDGKGTVEIGKYSYRATGGTWSGGIVGYKPCQYCYGSGYITK